MTLSGDEFNAKTKMRTSSSLISFGDQLQEFASDDI